MQDVQSDLSYLEWWAGRTLGGADVLPKQRLGVAPYSCSSVSPLLIPNQKVYVTLRAVNHAGIYKIAFLYIIKIC